MADKLTPARMARLVARWRESVVIDFVFGQAVVLQLALLRVRFAFRERAELLVCHIGGALLRCP